MQPYNTQYVLEHRGVKYDLYTSCWTWISALKSVVLEALTLQADESIRERLQLIFLGKRLQDERQINDYGLQSGSSIAVLISFKLLLYFQERTAELEVRSVHRWGTVEYFIRNKFNLKYDGENIIFIGQHAISSEEDFMDATKDFQAEYRVFIYSCDSREYQKRLKLSTDFMDINIVTI